MNEPNINPIAQKPHSKLGIASIIIGFVIIALGVLWYLASYLFFDQMFGPPMYRVTRVLDFTAVSIVIAVFFAVLHLVGMGFGIAGWISKKTRNLFPIIGTIFNLLLIIGDILLVIWWFLVFAIVATPSH